jgi:hypothetical protein
MSESSGTTSLRRIANLSLAPQHHIPNVFPDVFQLVSSNFGVGQGFRKLFIYGPTRTLKDSGPRRGTPARWTAGAGEQQKKEAWREMPTSTINSC